MRRNEMRDKEHIESWAWRLAHSVMEQIKSGLIAGAEREIQNTIWAAASVRLEMYLELYDEAHFQERLHAGEN